MSGLDNHKLHYEDIPFNTRKGGKDSKMSNKQAKAEAPAKAEYKKSRSEHAKDILIAVLITAVAAFVAGVHYSNNQHAATQRAVMAATAQTAEAPKK